MTVKFHRLVQRDAWEIMRYYERESGRKLADGFMMNSWQSFARLPRTLSAITSTPLACGERHCGGFPITSYIAFAEMTFLSSSSGMTNVTLLSA
jgi:hypothetical protein